MYQGEEAIDFGEWTTEVIVPKPGDEQQNGWACGYYTLNAMEAFARNASTDVIMADSVKWVRAAYSDLYRSLPLQ